ncbi:unnamed protein product [Callosobruchus maculatus]|nr:unnamed protein product [Callosobruchus maculatus]
MLRTFYSKPSIQRMYFQSFKSAEVDYEEKFSNTKKLNRTSVDIDTDLNINDNSLRDYTTTTAASTVEPIAKSMLYQDPYPECECGYKNGGEERTMPEPMIYSLEDDNDTYRPSAHMTAKFVCQKHMKDVEKLPSDFKDFFVIHQKQFHSDITSDTDSSDSDSSEDYDDLACCIYAMGTKMVILPNVHEPNNRSEMDLPYRGAARSLMPFNIFIVNPFDTRNRQRNAGSSSDNNQPGPSGGSNSNDTSTSQKAVNTDGGECSTANKVGCEKRKLDDSDSEADDESANKKRKVANNRESGCETIDSMESVKEDSESVSNDAQENEDIRHSSVDDLSNETNDEISKKSENIRNIDLKNEPSCSGSMTPDTKKMTENTSSKKWDSDSDSDTEKEKKMTPKERHKRKGRRSTDSGDGLSGKKKICKTREPQMDGNVAQVPLLDAGRGQRLEWAAEEREEGSGDQRPSTSRADRGPPNIRGNVINRAVEQLIFRGVGQLQPMQLQQEGWNLPNKISLRRISLRGYNKVTNMALLYLRYLQIELLDLTYTSVTKQEIENFLLYNPNCRVIHPMYCVCKPRNPF